ncbi:MAG TPA: endonuclease domain-containing protein [Balneolaceae bacterium]|nr:endonuclease domain-containing protein [Balneolaceae bacterium]
MDNHSRSRTQLARELRRHPTEAEKLLWEQIRKRKLSGYRFIRQKTFIYEDHKKQKKFFITDFYCAERKLVVEVDGEIHKSRKYYDEQRDLILQELGVNVLRIKNEELKQMDMVLKKIFKALTQP